MTQKSWACPGTPLGPAALITSSALHMGLVVARMPQAVPRDCWLPPLSFPHPGPHQEALRASAPHQLHTN